MNNTNSSVFQDFPTRVMRLLFAVLCFWIFVSAAVSAQTNVSGTADEAYCGSKYTEPFVPEQLWGCKMTNACRAHDICYGKCDPKGIKHGSAYCEKSEFSVERIKAKNKCDIDFFSAITKQNNSQWQCIALAGVYATAVVIGGQGPNNGRPMTNQAVRDLIETSKSPEEVREKFSALANLSKYQQLDLSNIQREGDSIKTPDFDFESLKV